MPSRFRIDIGVNRRASPGIARRGPKLFGCALLLAGMIILLLWVNAGFARYALTGFSWRRTEGTVVNMSRTSSPTIRFSTPDGASRSFTEDYMFLCRSHSLCIARDFDPGEVVPVVYDPAAPRRAFVDDWALLSNVIMWFVDAGGGLLFGLMLVVLLANRPLNASFRIGGGSGLP